MGRVITPQRSGAHKDSSHRPCKTTDAVVGQTVLSEGLGQGGEECVCVWGGVGGGGGG